ncbi:hypothetical protein [Paenibacillus odorifer]|uniref:hypothetical protein n=1 Tax=Paenibacillus odorifer TaxID=189426 RepID=UPI00117CA9E3|nr:hypothetical protein [Paenibacillus odorifer]
MDELGIDKIKDFDSGFLKLEMLRCDIFLRPIKELRAMKVEIDTLTEDYKQSALFTSMITAMIAIFTLLIGILRDLPKVVNPDDTNIFGVTTIILILYSGFMLIGILSLIKHFAKKAFSLSQFQKVLDLVITQREFLDQQYNEAIIEYRKHQNEQKKIIISKL